MKITRGELIDALSLATDKTCASYNELLKLYYEALDDFENIKNDKYIVHISLNELSNDAYKLIKLCAESSSQQT